MANEKSEFYAYTSTTEEFDEYAKEDFVNHVMCYYGYLDSALKLGKGILVYGHENPTVVYPVWNGEKIVGLFNVFLYDGEFSGSYTEGNADQLNNAKKLSSDKNPIMLIKHDDKFLLV